MTPHTGAHEVRDPWEHGLERWARIVEEVERGYALTYDDFLNDLDLRHALSGLPRHDARRTQLSSLDERFRAHTFPSGACAWGDENAAAEGWDREREWYYWRLPTHPGPAFHE